MDKNEIRKKLESLYKDSSEESAEERLKKEFMLEPEPDLTFVEQNIAQHEEGLISLDDLLSKKSVSESVAPQLEKQPSELAPLSIPAQKKPDPAKSPKREQKGGDLPPNVYDLFLRTFYHYQAEWLLVQEKGIWLGVLAKKMVLTRLAEIENFNDPFVKTLKTEDLFFPEISEVLEVLVRQKEFPIVDATGHFYDHFSRAAFLEMAELSKLHSGPLPMVMSSIYNARTDKKIKDSVESLPSKREKVAPAQVTGQKIDWFISLLLESVPFGLAAVDMRGRIIFFNHLFKQLLSQSAELETKKILQIIEEFEAMMNRKLSEKQQMPGEIVWPPFRITLRLVPIQTERKTVGYLCLADAGD